MAAMTNLKNLYEVTCFDNEDNDALAAAAAAAEAAAAKATEAVSGGGDNQEKVFTQEQVNEIVGKRQKGLQEKFQALEGTYTELLEQTNLSDAARTKLQEDLENVQKQMRTKEQQIEHERLQAETRFQAELNGATEERDFYKELFETSTSQREITDAAVKLDGFNPADFIDKLGPRSKIVDEVDSAGVKTGRKVTQVTWEVKDPKTGKVTQTQQRPEAVIQLMKDDPMGQFANLFKPNVAKGVGGGTAAAQAGGAGKVDVSKLSMEEYMKLREDPDFRRRIGTSY
jgi:TolA-binding protein